MKYAIYLTDAGSAAARPVRGMIELSDEPTETLAARLADQVALLAGNEAVIEVLDTAAFTDIDDDEDTYDFTVDTTATPPVALTPVTVARFSLEQRQAEYRRKRDFRIAAAAARANLGRPFTETEGEGWFSYLASLQDLADAPANPEAVVFPTVPTEAAGTGGVPLWARFYRRGNILGSVGLTLGFPTGAIIEEGESGNGYYVKFTNGLLVCIERAFATYNSAANLTLTWTFPHEFDAFELDRRAVIVTLSQRDNSGDIPTAQLTTTQMAEVQVNTNSLNDLNVLIVVRDPARSLVSGDICWLEMIAIGKWQ